MIVCDCMGPPKPVLAIAAAPGISPPTTTSVAGMFLISHYIALQPAHWEGMSDWWLAALFKCTFVTIAVVAEASNSTIRFLLQNGRMNMRAAACVLQHTQNKHKCVRVPVLSCRSNLMKAACGPEHQNAVPVFHCGMCQKQHGACAIKGIGGYEDLKFWNQSSMLHFDAHCIACRSSHIHPLPYQCHAERSRCRTFIFLTKGLRSPARSGNQMSPPGRTSLVSLTRRERAHRSAGLALPLGIQPACNGGVCPPQGLATPVTLARHCFRSRLQCAKHPLQLPRSKREWLRCLLV